ncbi:MAG: YqaJ viral recombinase family protein, partial [Peptococcus niger]
MTEAIKTLDMSQEEWLEQRKKGIGGSDAGAICGLNPWKSAVEVYLDKLGELPPVEDNERMRMGVTLKTTSPSA